MQFSNINIFSNSGMSRDKVVFNVVGAGNKVHNFRTDALGLKTVADLHAGLREDCYLSDKDFKDKSMSLRVDLYETETVDPVS